jgi:hypothetical protein
VLQKHVEHFDGKDDFGTRYFDALLDKIFARVLSSESFDFDDYEEEDDHEDDGGHTDIDSLVELLVVHLTL